MLGFENQVRQTRCETSGTYYLNPKPTWVLPSTSLFKASKRDTHS